VAQTFWGSRSAGLVDVLPGLHRQAGGTVFGCWRSVHACMRIMPDALWDRRVAYSVHRARMQLGTFPLQQSLGFVFQKTFNFAHLLGRQIPKHVVTASGSWHVQSLQDRSQKSPAIRGCLGVCPMGCTSLALTCLLSAASPPSLCRPPCTKKKAHTSHLAEQLADL